MDESIEDVFIDAGKMPEGAAAIIWYQDGSVTSILPKTDEDVDDSILPDSPECWAAMVMMLVTDFDDPFLSRYRDSIVEKMHRFMMMVIEDDADPGWDEGGPPKSSPSAFRGLQIVRDEE